VRSRGGSGRRDRGELANEVLAVLAAEGAMTPRQVLERLDGSLAYTTVLTTLARLHDKGAVTRESAGRTFTYSLAEASTVQARAMRRTLDAAVDREQVLSRFLDELDPSDVPVLRRLLGRDRAR
jgi:predicted transcriptional regulator